MGACIGEEKKVLINQRRCRDSVRMTRGLGMLPKQFDLFSLSKRRVKGDLITISKYLHGTEREF